MTFLQEPDFTMKTIMVVGQVKSSHLNSLATRYLADVVHKYPTLQAVQDAGMATFTSSEYNTLLIGMGLDATRRRQLANLAKTRKMPTRVVALTVDPPGLDDTWVPLSPDATVEEMASVLQCSPRHDEPLMIIVVSTKGGVGKSTVAVNTAVILGQMGLRVALLEDDWTSRSVQPLLGIPDGPYTSANLVSDIISNDGYVSPELVQQYLVDAFGIKALIGPPSLLTEFPITPDMAKDILSVIGRELAIDVVVIDAPPDFIHTSCFTFGLLRGTENRAKPPLILIPVAPEKFLLRSVDDTVAAITYMKHPKERIWPVVNCTRPTHDPDSLRDSGVLWRPPAGIVPYCPDAQYVGETQTPLVAQQGGGKLRQFWLNYILGVADTHTVKKSYVRLAQEIKPLVAQQQEQNGHL